MAPYEGLTHLSSTPLAQSNVALLGTKLDHDLRLLSAHAEPAWSAPGVGTQARVWSWRVEDFKLVEWRTGDLGAGDFQEGDSYVVLKSVAPVASKPEVLIHDIHFWLGSQTSQDEAGVAAYKSVELDELLGGYPTQHRQTQGSESPAFLALFHPHFLVALGGHASGFHHVSLTTSKSLHLAAPRLWEITLPALRLGQKKVVKVQEVLAKKESVQRGNVYILDRGDVLEQWNGKEAHPLEKAKAAEVARSWVDGRGGKASLKVFDDGSSDTSFFLDLGVDASELPIEFPPQAVSPPSSEPKASPKSHNLLAPHLPAQPFSRTSLHSSALLLIITQPTLYVWVGSEIPQEQKRAALSNAQKVVAKLVEEGELKRLREMVKVSQGGERDEFWSSVEEQKES